MPRRQRREFRGQVDWTPELVPGGHQEHDGVSNLAHARNLLAELKRLRERADYDIDEGNWPLDVVDVGERYALLLSRELQEIFDRYPPGGDDPSNYLPR